VGKNLLRYGERGDEERLGGMGKRGASAAWKGGRGVGPLQEESSRSIGKKEVESDERREAALLVKRESSPHEKKPGRHCFKATGKETRVA